ncbi:hypothetical protein NMY22_g2642 [Coprinellus aureogranulatus]|nr:hypothetical protein NMY22_g2642 [Coprinellus aureogranulatus]
MRLPVLSHFNQRELDTAPRHLAFGGDINAVVFQMGAQSVSSDPRDSAPFTIVKAPDLKFIHELPKTILS